MVAWGLIALGEPSRAEGTTYKYDSLSFRSLRKNSIITARAHDSDAAQRFPLVDPVRALFELRPM